MIENNRYYWSHLKTRSVTVRVQPKDEPMGVVFRVSNMIDVGKGRQTVVLEHVDHFDGDYRRPKQNNVSIPFRMGQLDFVYTSRQNPTVQNVQVLLGCLYEGQRAERIITDVICPGDILVFRQKAGTSKIKSVDAFRIVKVDTYVKNKAGYAL